MDAHRKTHAMSGLLLSLLLTACAHQPEGCFGGGHVRLVDCDDAGCLLVGSCEEMSK